MSWGWEGVKSLTIALNEREGNGCRVSISEMAFYKSDSLAEDIAALFADGTFTALKPGVTGEQISALSGHGVGAKGILVVSAQVGHQDDIIHVLRLGKGIGEVAVQAPVLGHPVGADQSLRLSWGQTKDASYYQVFYRQAGQTGRCRG